ncbi:CPBP family intramembrane metalloprotease [Nocardioides sp. GY 10113]|uniref:CPBP family intramembrane glutamic endopeptidase n=1 Tax=Nocardioides sp. GY 10113 TaxID=2569761 RepID=UPI0010A82AAE|nr:CPBP family intramembrane glutamic endopeptidase [Nocardioides sp. GY 10113]TIC87726.1 CPBP family intramembrane metalloprotease [Nocardioides sp. GY 10113]
MKDEPQHGVVSPPDAPGHTVAHGGRRLTWPRLLGLLVLALLVLPLAVPGATQAGADEYPTVGDAADQALQAAATLAVVVLAITWLRWWRPVWREPDARPRARPWVWIAGLPLPLALATADWSRIAAVPDVALTLALFALLVGAGEELLFRGVMLTFLRERHREWVAVLVTTVVFATLHFTEGVPGVLDNLAFGYLAYLMRRVSGGLLVPILVHAAVDFSVWSAFCGPGPYEPDSTSFLLFLSFVGLIVVLLVLRRRMFDPVTSAAGTSVPPEQDKGG